MWIIICLLASAGIVQAIGWLAGSMRRPVNAAGVFQVIELSSDPEQLEAQLRYELFMLRWSTSWRPQFIVLLDTGLTGEGRDICCNLLAGVSGVTVCKPDELPELLTHGSFCGPAA